MTYSSRELVERLKTSLPLAMTLPDPVTGEPFVVNRDNMLALLVVDADNLVLESQTVAMLFGEMARVHAAAKLAKEQADVEFRRWKATKAAEGRRVLDNGEDSKGKKKPPTKEQVEDYYRLDPEYEDAYRRTNRASVIADMVADLKKGFELKQRALHDLHGVTFGHDRVQAGDDRLTQMAERIEAEAIPMMEESAGTLADIASTRAPHPSKEDKKPKARPKRPKTPKGSK
jgi:hypothetical protein